jgi:hypothetical protein
VHHRRHERERAARRRRSSRRALDPPRLASMCSRRECRNAGGRAREAAGGRASGRGRGRRARAGRRANQPRACRASGRYRLRRAECRARTRVTQRLRISPRATRGLRRGAATVDKKRVFVNEHPVDKNDKTRECTGTQQSELVRANSARGHNAQQTFCEKLSRPYLLILDYEKKRRTPL